MPVLVALVLSVPLGWYVGRDIGWLRDAWQVSAVLLGFVIALLIFLLQAVAGRNLRAARTYKAVIADSYVAWPVAFALVFLIWVAIIDRYSPSPDAGSSSAAPAWVTTYSMGFFVLALLVFAPVLASIRRLLAPSGVARTLTRTLTVDVERAVEERLTRGRSLELLDAAFIEAGINPGPSFEGYSVRLGQAGYVDDVNLQLPRRLARRGALEEVLSWSLSLGAKVESDAVIATLRRRPSELTERLCRGAVRVRPRARDGGDWAGVLQDAIDLGLRAFYDGTTRDLELVIDVIVEGLATVPVTYRCFLRRYDAEEVYRHAWDWPEEVSMLDPLKRMCREVFGAEKNTEAAAELVVLPYKMANMAFREDAHLLFELATDLWLYQGRHAQDISLTVWFV